MSAKRKINKTGRPPGPDTLIISKDKIEEYVTVHTQKKNAEDRMAKLRLEVLDLFHRGAVCDRSGWNILVLSTYDRAEVDWKEQYANLLSEFYPDDVEERMSAIEAAAPKKQVEAILPRAHSPVA